MTSEFGKLLMLALAVSTILVAVAIEVQAQQPQQAIRNGDVLTGQLNAMRSPAANGKRVSTFQLLSEPRKLPPPGGLCGLETGPETFQLVTASDAQAAQLKGFVGREISVRIEEVSCAQEAGQMSEAVVTKWSMVTRH
jgi:hypothetical protein